MRPFSKFLASNILGKLACFKLLWFRQPHLEIVTTPVKSVCLIQEDYTSKFMEIAVRSKCCSGQFSSKPTKCKVSYDNKCT